MTTPNITQMEIKRNLNHLRRQMAELDQAAREIITKRRLLVSELLSETERWQDAANAGWLTQQGAPAVAWVEEWLGA